MPKKVMLTMRMMKRERKITKVPKWPQEPLLLEAQTPLHMIKRVRGTHLQGNLTRCTSYMP